VIQDDIGVRIGELSRRVGVSPDVLRAWERRYGVLSPRRSAAGQRLYTAADEQRVRRMRQSIESGYSPRVAARLAIADGGDHRLAGGLTPTAVRGIDELAETLRTSLFDLADGAANRTLDQLITSYGVEQALVQVVLPLLREIGDRWARNELTVGQEHFASALLTGRLRALARGWDDGDGPRVLAACPSGEAHDLGLLCFALLLRERGLRITYLGASVPSDSLFDASQRVHPAVAVIAGVREEPFWDSYEALAELSFAHPLMLGGAGASAALADVLRAQLLPQDPVAAADMVAATAAVAT
jgi:DNA-binding transcriptional MerR regulator/methylmalonyl-CoA mutase cobalamin-binding subunit